jgi:hypothetical protein
MAVFRAHVGLAILPPLLVAAGCAGAGRAPCGNCDAGNADTPPSQAYDAPSSEAVRAAEAAAALDTEADAAEVWLPATRDAPESEARPPTPVVDGGYLLVEDFTSKAAPGWDMLDVRNGSISAGTWAVILGDDGSLFTQGLLDATTWHIAYATAELADNQIVEARLRIAGFYAETPSYQAALFGRYDAATDSGYFVALRGDGSVTLRRRDRGTNASWGGSVAQGIRAGVWYTVRLEIIGNEIAAFVDGVEVCAVSDGSPLKSGHVGLGAFGATLEVERLLAADAS